MAHQKDLEVQDRHGVRYLRYWYDEGTKRVFCLVEAPSKEAAMAVHREAHGTAPDAIRRTARARSRRQRIVLASQGVPRGGTIVADPAASRPGLDVSE